MSHGTYTRAIAGKCGCKPCGSYRLRRAYDRANGVSGRIDATQPRSHLERLLAHGWTQDQIAAATGLNQATISIVLSGRYKGVQKSTAAAILNVRLGQTPPVPRGLIDATGTRRRLQALAAIGYTLPGIARRIRTNERGLYEIADGRWETVRRSTVIAVARVYRELSTRPAPRTRWAEQARAMAAERGWHGPMAWDDIDNPHAEPHDVHAEPELKRDDLAELRRQEVFHLAGFSVPPEEIAARLGIGFTTVTGILRQQRTAA
jgi:transcriptional regulator with XRE-family HTH domain